MTWTFPFQIQKVRVDSVDQWAVTLRSLMNARRRRESVGGSRVSEWSVEET